MQKKIDLKNRIVEFWEVDTGVYEDEIISYLKRQMRVKFHNVVFNNSNYVFLINPGDQSSNSIMVSGYRKKQPGEKWSVTTN